MQRVIKRESVVLSCKMSKVTMLVTLFLCLMLTGSFSRQVYAETELPDKVRTMSYYGYNKTAAALYATPGASKAVGALKKGSRFELVGKSSKYNRGKILYNNKYYYMAFPKIVLTGCNYTSKKYTTEQKLKFVNKYSSKTKYLIWISNYTQQVNIFRGKKGHWKLIRSCICTTGGYQHRTPHGIYTVGKKEKSWNYYNRYLLYVTHFDGLNSFHSRIHRKKAYGGGFYYPTLGAPGSNGCIRLYDKDCYYIYKNIPKGTKVISY